MLKSILILTLALSFISCEYFEEEKEPEILLSKIDGEQYAADMQSEINSRKDTRLIEDGKLDDVSYDALLNICDSLSSKSDEWRPRYFQALSTHLENSNYNIDSKDNLRFGIGIFNYFVFYPKELITLFNDCSTNQVDFWNAQLGAEIKRKESMDNISEETIIGLASSNCIDCDEDTQFIIATMVKTLVLE